MSFVQAFLESSRSKGEYLVQLEGLQSIALESFALDAVQIVEIFNAILASDSGFEMQVQPVQETQTGLVVNVLSGSGESRSVFIDVGYVPDTQEYVVSERDSGVSAKHNEFDMKLAVAQIVMNNLPDAQYLKFYRALLQSEEAVSNEDSVVPFATVEQIMQTPAVAYSAPQQEAVVTPFPSATTHAEHVFAPIEDESDDDEDDDDDIWGDDDSDSGVDKHLGTDVVMR